MTKVSKPIIHRRDHEHGGTDPIRITWDSISDGPPGGGCICVPPTLSSPFAGVVMSIPDLLAYWRLGETGTPWLDTSGVTPLAPLTTVASGTAITADVTGALVVDDDGAVRFNYDGISPTGGQALTTGGGGKDFDDFGPDGYTVVAWVNVKASALTRRGVIIGNRVTIAGGPDYSGGWALEVVYPARTVRFTRGHLGGGPEVYATTPSGVVADEWHFYAGVYDIAAGKIRLYVDGTLVDEQTSGPGYYALHIGVQFGYGFSEFSDSWLYGTVDEAAIWTRPLTVTEIGELYAAGVISGSTGDSVLVPDGTGGATWAQVTPGAIAPGADGQALMTVSGAAAWSTLPSGGGTSPADTAGWMPLTTVVAGVPELVWDASDTLIPTYGSF